jgi:hypothetical protein
MSAWGVLANEMRKILSSKDDVELGTLLSSKKYRSWLGELGILGEFYEDKPHSMVTIRLPKGKEPQYYRDCLTNLNEIKWVTECEAVFEGGGTDNPHIHLLSLKEKYHKGNVIKRFAKRFGVPKNMIDYEQGDTLELLAKRRQYIRGDKADAKQEAVEADRQFREAHDIPHLVKF